MDEATFVSMQAEERRLLSRIAVAVADRAADLDALWALAAGAGARVSHAVDLATGEETWTVDGPHGARFRGDDLKQTIAFLKTVA